MQAFGRLSSPIPANLNVKLTLEALHPRTAVKSDEEKRASEGKLRSHRNPDTLQAIALGKGVSQGEAHQPHGTQIDGGWLPGIARSHADTIGYDARCKERLGKGLDAKAGSAQLADALYRREHTYHLGGKDIHHHSHQCHHAHAQSHRHIGEIAAEIGTPGTMRLTHQGGSGITDTIPRHIAKALGGDGKRVGSNGDIAQWCHNHGAHDLRTAHQDILYGYRDADLAGMVQVFLHPPERFLVLTQIEYPVTACREVEIGQRDADIGKRRAAGSSHYAHLHDVDEEVIEHHIADAYQYRHHTRGMHVCLPT